jgi:hypothetical protein
MGALWHPKRQRKQLTISTLSLLRGNTCRCPLSLAKPFLLLTRPLIVALLASSPKHIIPGHDPLVMDRYPAVGPDLKGIAVKLDEDPRVHK